MDSAPRTVSVAVAVKYPLEFGLLDHCRRSLRHPVGRIRHPEQTYTCPAVFGYLHAPHRPREVTARGHPVPQLVEVVLPLLLEQPDADRVHARRTLIGPDLLPRLINEALTDLKRLHFRPGPGLRLLPCRVGRQLALVCAAPSLQPHYRAFLTTTSRPVPVPRIGTLPLAVSAACGPPSRSQGHFPGRRYRGDRFSCSMPAPAANSRHLYTGHRQGSPQAAPRLRAHARQRTPLPREFCAPPVLMPSFRLSMRQQWFTHVRLLATHPTR